MYAKHSSVRVQHNSLMLRNVRFIVYVMQINAEATTSGFLFNRPFCPELLSKSELWEIVGAAFFTGQTPFLLSDQWRRNP